MSETTPEPVTPDTEGTTLPEAPVEEPAETTTEAPATPEQTPEAPETTEAPAEPVEVSKPEAHESLGEKMRARHNLGREAPVSPPGVITSNAGEIAAQAENDGNASVYKDAVKSGVDPQLATHLATVPTVATTTGGDGISRIVNTNVDADWVPAPVESDPEERARLEKASALLEERLDGSALLER